MYSAIAFTLQGRFTCPQDLQALSRGEVFVDDNLQSLWLKNYSGLAGVDDRLQYLFDLNHFLQHFLTILRFKLICL